MPEGGYFIQEKVHLAHGFWRPKSMAPTSGEGFLGTSKPSRSTRKTEASGTCRREAQGGLRLTSTHPHACTGLPRRPSLFLPHGLITF